ncbi:MAG: 4-hydroxy-tetrahydrodipicolinate synthase [Solirubrobacterales bacterium]|nr:4-hydroxy-tetrahydrodipicolinate synthase [Solirubrobacterales bacterium]
MVTPFDDDGRLDADAARQLASHLVDNGSSGLVLAGSTGEASTLADDEKLRLGELVLETVGDRATVILGTGSNDTAHAARLTKAASQLGVDGALVVAPYYNKPNARGVREHFARVAEAAGELAVIVYNIPSRCVINIAPEALAELAAQSPNVVAVKQANSAELGPVEGLDLLAGNDDVFLETLRRGGTGGILVASHVVGNEMRRVLELHIAGEAREASELDARLAPVYAAMSITSNPTPVKAALEMEGLIGAHLRLPMVPADDAERKLVAEAISAFRGGRA